MADLRKGGVRMSRVLSRDDLLRYLQSQMDDFKKEEAMFGLGDRIVKAKLDAMIACKEMVEAVLGEPVNLGKDGVVWVGFEREG